MVGRRPRRATPSSGTHALNENGRGAPHSRTKCTPWGTPQSTPEGHQAISEEERDARERASPKPHRQSRPTPVHHALPGVPRNEQPEGHPTPRRIALPGVPRNEQPEGQGSGGRPSPPAPRQTRGLASIRTLQGEIFSNTYPSFAFPNSRPTIQDLNWLCNLLIYLSNNRLAPFDRMVRMLRMITPWEISGDKTAPRRRSGHPRANGRIRAHAAERPSNVTATGPPGALGSSTPPQTMEAERTIAISILKTARRIGFSCVPGPRERRAPAVIDFGSCTKLIGGSYEPRNRSCAAGHIRRAHRRSFVGHGQNGNVGTTSVGINERGQVGARSHKARVDS